MPVGYCALRELRFLSGFTFFTLAIAPLWVVMEVK
jgi:hypothetical protein